MDPAVLRVRLPPHLAMALDMRIRELKLYAEDFHELPSRRSVVLSVLEAYLKTRPPPLPRVPVDEAKLSEGLRLRVVEYLTKPRIRKKKEPPSAPKNQYGKRRVIYERSKTNADSF